MSNSLIKANRVNIGQDEARVIDSNQAVIDRLQLLNEILETSNYDSDFAEDFTEGLDAVAVDALLSDPEETAVDMSAVSEDIDRMIAEANAQAEEIINAANAQAEEIIAGANAEADQIRQEAFASAKAEGEQAGYAEGIAKTEAIEASLNERMRQNEEAYEAMISELEPKFVALLSDIYSHVFNVDLSDKTELVLGLLKDAIRNIDGGHNFFVHVSKQDYEYVAANKEMLLTGLASTCVVEIIEDVALGASECFIETESGIYDCGLGTQLELLKKELNLLSYVSRQ